MARRRTMLLSFEKMNGESSLRIMVIRYHSEPDMAERGQQPEITGEPVQILEP